MSTWNPRAPLLDGQASRGQTLTPIPLWGVTQLTRLTHINLMNPHPQVFL